MSDEKEDPRMDMGRNSEHYSDPTPGTAWENMRREEKRLDAARLVVVSALVPILRQTAELAGFEIIGRIPLRDKATGFEDSPQNAPARWPGRGEVRQKAECF